MTEEKQSDDDLILKGAVESISAIAKIALKSKLVAEDEQKALLDAQGRFDSAAQELVNSLDDNLKPSLAVALICALEIGSKATVSETTTKHVRRGNAAKATEARANKPAIIERRKIVAEVSKGRIINSENRWQMAGAFQSKINRILKEKGFSEATRKQISDDLKMIVP